MHHMSLTSEAKRRLPSLWLSNAGVFWNYGRNIHIERGVYIGTYVLLDATSYDDGKIMLGARTELHDFCRSECYGGSIEVGDDCSITPFSVVCGHGGLTIGSKVRIAAHVGRIPANHTFTNFAVPIMHQPESRRGIAVESDVWISAHAVILDGVTVGRWVRNCCGSRGQQKRATDDYSCWRAG
jgi:acetyltransferase-like isoleucine patch superfamily enzyme